jgi:ferredoxin, 2Fe-2S
MTIAITFIAAGAQPERAAARFDVKTGQSLMQAAVANNVHGIEADCGGLLTCATCHVYVQEPHASRLAPPSDDELAMLDFVASPRQPNSRLSCQIDLTEAMDGLVVELPASQH